MRTRHRICRFRKNKRLRHQRFRSRIFHRDTLCHANNQA
ncbi:NAD-dependent protein deacylase, partial [Hafnia alvei]